MNKLISKVNQVAFHRNGIGGVGFHAVLFESEEENCAVCGDAWGWTNGLGVTSCSQGHQGGTVKKATKMLGIVFDSDDMCTAVFDVNLLVDPTVGVAFGENSFRGDRYAAELKKAIAENKSDGSVKIGPFAIPTMRV